MNQDQRIAALEAKQKVEAQENKDWQKVIEQALQDGLKLVLGIIGEPNSQDEEIKELKAKIEAQELTINVLLKKEYEESPFKVKVVDDIGCTDLEEGKEYDVHGVHGVSSGFYYLVCNGEIESIRKSQCKAL